MHLVYFLTLGTIFSVVIGEFGKFPFGANLSFGITDFLASLTVGFLLICKVGIKKNIQLPKPFLILIAFWIVGFISLVYSGNLLGGLYLLRFVIYSSFFWVGYDLIKDKVINLPNIFSKIFFSGLLISGLGFIQFIVFPDLKPFEKYGYDPHYYRLFSTFLDPNFVGVYLNICLILCIYNYLTTRHKRFLIFIAILFSAIILTFSRSAYLMLIPILFIFTFKHSKKILILLIVFLVITYLLVPKFSERINGAFLLDKSASERIGSWQNGWDTFSKNPLLGVGFNNLRFYFSENNLYQAFQINGSHSGAGVDSSLLFVLATQGILGFSVYLFFWLYLFKKFLKSNVGRDLKFSFIVLMIGLLVNSQFINSLFYPEIMLIYFLILGSSTAKASQEG